MIYKTPPWILGTLLGAKLPPAKRGAIAPQDGHIDPFGRLFIEHSIKQKAYFFHKLLKLQHMKVLPANSKAIYRTQIHSKTGKAYTSLCVRSQRVFQVERKLFYPEKEKRIGGAAAPHFVPLGIEQCFNEETLAFWYMDDGGRNSKYGTGMVLDVSSFSENDRATLAQVLNNRFDVATTFHNRSEKNVKLYIRASSAQRFCNLIRPFVIPEMLYKLIKPPTT
jgi:hypothetical protein